MERIFRFPIKVGKESIDVLGHTNNKEYLRWMEEAALAHSDSLGWTMDRYLGIGKVFVARLSTCGPRSKATNSPCLLG